MLNNQAIILKYDRDLKNVVDTSFEEGKAEGWEEGLQEGLQMGKQEGLQEGKRTMASHMKAKGLDIALIAELTGLSQAEIESITAADL